VHDIGSGHLVLAHELLKLGATHVRAVDKEAVETGDERITQIVTYFDAFKELVPVAFLSWPVNHGAPGLLEIVSRTHCLIYLGKNTDGAACGYPDLFRYLLRREVLTYVPTKRNTLIVYGPRFVLPREPLGEELAALVPSTLWTFEQVEQDRALLLEHYERDEG